MIYLSIALVVVAAMCWHAVNKYIDLKFAENAAKNTLNTDAAYAALSAAFDERFTKFDGRLNQTWTAMSSTKEELNSIKLQLALKVK